MKKWIIIFTVLIIAAVMVLNQAPRKAGAVRNGAYDTAVEGLSESILERAEAEGFDILVENRGISDYNFGVMIGDNMSILCSERFLEDIIGCSVNAYKTGEITVERKNIKIEYPAKGDAVTIFRNGDKSETVSIDGKIERDDEGELYLPVSEILAFIGYKAEYMYNRRAMDFTCIDDGKYLPEKYDMRTAGRVTPIRDQGIYGTCWAFASLGALETILMPGEENVYSVDHMSMNNNFSLDISEGGEHGMSISYLASWKGPVMDKDDPYGDSKTNPYLHAVKHLEEAIIIEDRNDEVIKSAIFKYGGVETSLYLEMPYGGVYSEYYNSENGSYYYNGDMKPNHAVVLVGWDDEYPKERFSNRPEHDGAFICKNSWGETFGDGGYFYVSYDDVNICQETVIYSKLAEPDDFDNIYQTDLLGWVGQMGFSQDSAYFANCYSAGHRENLSAVAFYATGPDTTFSIYIVRHFTDKKSLNYRMLVGEGQTRYAGYYTVKFDEEIPLDEGEKFAVIVNIKTPGSERPIAIECDDAERTENLNLEDGEGYMSLYGEVWHRAENSDCNICLKAFTKKRTDEQIEKEKEGAPDTDGEPDKEVGTDTEGKPDKETGQSTEGKPDKEVGPDTDGKPDKEVGTDIEGKPDKQAGENEKSE